MDKLPVFEGLKDELRKETEHGHATREWRRNSTVDRLIRSCAEENVRQKMRQRATLGYCFYRHPLTEDHEDEDLSIGSLTFTASVQRRLLDGLKHMYPGMQITLDMAAEAPKYVDVVFVW
jgi:hypothetical protein